MVLRAHFLLPWVLFLPIATPPAQADPVTVTFTVFPAVGDPVNTGPSTGFFTFDSSLIPPGGGEIKDTSGLGATQFSFRWSRTHWTAGNADIGEMQFSASGQLLYAFIGGRPSLYGMTSAPPSEVVDDFWADVTPGVERAITYTNADFAGTLFGRLVTDSVPAPVPEPSTLLLLAAGTALTARTARRRRRTESGDCRNRR